VVVNEPCPHDAIRISKAARGMNNLKCFFIFVEGFWGKNFQ